MFGLLVVASYFFLEIMSVNRFWDSFGFVNTAFALLMDLILGVGLIRAQGTYLVMKLSQATMKGEPPANALVHSLLMFLGGLLFLSPGFFSDAIALVLVVPGMRHLIVYLLKKRFSEQFVRAAQGGFGSGQFRVFTFGSGSGGFGDEFSRRARSDDSAGESRSVHERDVTPRVIDVTPISVESNRGSGHQASHEEQ